MKTILCISAIAVAASQTLAGEVNTVVRATPVVAVQTATVQSFSTEPQTFTQPGATFSVPAETRTFEIPGQSVTVAPRSVTIPGKNYALVETTSNVCTACVPQAVSTNVCGPAGCGTGGGASVDVTVQRRGIFAKLKNRERRERRRLFRNH